MKNEITSHEDKIKSIIDTINSLESAELTLLAQHLEQSSVQTGELEIKTLNDSLKKRANITQKSAARFITKIITGLTDKETLSKKERIASITLLLYKTISLISHDLDITPKSILSKISSTHRVENSGTENSYFKYWFKDGEGNIHHWKGTGLPPKGFHDLILNEQLELYNVIKTPKPKLFDWKKKG
jgi:hypothetical protein